MSIAFSSNGEGFVLRDSTGLSTERKTTLVLDAFSSPADLRARYRALGEPDTGARGHFLSWDCSNDGGTKHRVIISYRINTMAVVIEAIVITYDLILLVMAALTGRTCLPSALHDAV
ncbi:MAG: hypothetical protein J4F42_16180 [Desulfurellaceae bacterium]|nr:hypothetical protein [Desulfurellaceae bacterium]